MGGAGTSPSGTIGAVRPTSQFGSRTGSSVTCAAAYSRAIVRLANRPTPFQPHAAAPIRCALQRSRKVFIMWQTLDTKDTTPKKENGTSQPASNSDRKSTRLNSSHVAISYAVFCLKKKKKYPKVLT